MVSFLGINGAPAAEPLTFSSPEDLKRLSLEELMNVEVTTAARRPEYWFTSPTAIQVITGEDIRRSGASSIPEALRLGSTLQVAQVNSREWAISVRGFNNTLANKLLVMINGRVVYTPLFAGVFWDVQDTLLEDIDRIEVVRGPGASLWGANAVNGVINILTKTAKETQGGLVTAGGGSLLRGFEGARYGWDLGHDVYCRITEKYFERDNTVLPDGSEATNYWRFGQAGLRLDWLPPHGDTFTLEVEGYGGEFEQAAPGDTTANGQHVLSRWSRALEGEGEFAVQCYWDRTHRKIPGTFAEDLNTFDADFQHRFPLGTRQTIVWGGAYRLMADDVANSAGLAFVPEDRNMQLVSGFLQDEIKAIPDLLDVTFGTKLEHNDFSGFEIQPSGRCALLLTEHQTLWAAASRAVRSPSRIDTDFRVPASPPYAISGGNNFDSEKLVALELGYRIRPHERVTVSLAAFYNFYDDIRSLEYVGSSSNMTVIRNGQHGESKGFELTTIYQVTDTWRLSGGYTLFDKHISNKAGHFDINEGHAEGNDPNHQFVIRSILDLPYHLQFDCNLRYVDRLPNPHVQAYFSSEVRIAWRPLPALELAIIGQNLFDDQHPEFASATARQEIPRSVYGKVTWRF